MNNCVSVWFSGLVAIPLMIAPSHAETGKPARIQPQGIKFEEIAVKAPFDMPVIKRPVFPDKEFVVTDFGAKEGGKCVITDAIRKAIFACNDAGGGSVIIPKGRWWTGKVHLRSNVNLHLAEGAELLFSDNPEDYLPAVQSSWEGMECFNYSPLIYAYGCTNVALTGKGTIKAKLDTWTEWFKRPPAHMEALKQLYTLAAKGVPVEGRQMAVGENHMRPPFIQFNRCRNILIQDVNVINSPFWTIHLLLCDGAVVRRVNISAHGHNNDGIDPESTRNLLVEDCRFDQGDDAIAIKSGANQDGWRRNTPSENILIRRCDILRGNELVAIGSELSGGIRNVYVHDCTFRNKGDSKPNNLMLIKTNRGRGGFVENVYLENISANTVRGAVLGIETDVLYQWRDLVPIYEERLTLIRGIHVSNVKVQQTGVSFNILGDVRRPVSDIFLEKITINRGPGQLHRYENVENVHEIAVQVLEPEP